MPTIAIIGASGTMGRLISQKAAERQLDLVLTGRNPDRLIELAQTLPTGHTRAALLDIADPAALEGVVARADLVLNPVGPFTRLAKPIIDACLQAGTPYIDPANELQAVQTLLARDREAREKRVQLITGAGFGVVATETLALLLAQTSTNRSRRWKSRPPRPLRTPHLASRQLSPRVSPRAVRATLRASWWRALQVRVRQRSSSRTDPAAQFRRQSATWLQRDAQLALRMWLRRQPYATNARRHPNRRRTSAHLQWRSALPLRESS